MSDQSLEPEAEDMLKAGADVANRLSANPALYSIAISLKRIADMMAAENDAIAPELKPTIIMNAEEYLRYQHKLKTF